MNFKKIAATISLMLFLVLIGLYLFTLPLIREDVPRFFILASIFIYGFLAYMDIQLIRGKPIGHRLPKPDRVGNVLFVPESIGLRDRFGSLWSAFGTLLTRNIEVHYEDGTWHTERFGSDMKVGTFLSEIDTFLVGYRSRIVDLDKYEDYKALVFLEWVNNLSEDTRSAVIAEYKVNSHED